jgi:hypothetical protein
MYANQVAVFATQHGKEKIFTRPTTKVLGLKLCVPDDINTDQFGTFSGEIPRAGSMLDALEAKANLGIKLTGLSLAFASEGSFGPHKQNPFIFANREIALFMDKNHELMIYESVISTKTNYASIELSEKFSSDSLQDFLKRVEFPRHAVILKQKIEGEWFIHKGIQDYRQLLAQIKSGHSLTIETDMRAHLNPNRQAVIRELAFKLMRRVISTCPECATLGWGLVSVQAGLPCADCYSITQLVKNEVYGCAKCLYQEIKPAKHGLRSADPRYCDFCNP